VRYHIVYVKPKVFKRLKKLKRKLIKQTGVYLSYSDVIAIILEHFTKGD